MGSFEARRGQWGGLIDVIYMDLSNSKANSQSLTVGGAGLPAGTSANLDYGLKGSVWTLAGTYRAVADRNTTLDVLAGARVLDIQTNLNWQLSGNVAGIALPDRAARVRPASRTGTRSSASRAASGSPRTASGLSLTTSTWARVNRVSPGRR